MDDIRSSKLAMGLRKNKGDIIRREWLNNFSTVCNEAFSEEDLIEIEFTEHLKHRFYEQLPSRQAKRLYWMQGQETLIINNLEKLQGTFDRKVILFSNVDYYIGAVRIEVDLVLSSPFEIWRIVGEDLAVTTEDLADGFCLELTLNGRQPYTYEFTLWGRFALIFDSIN